MKKIILLVFTVVACSSVVFSQNSSSFYKSSYESRNSGSFDKSTSLISIGYGFPNVPTNDFSGLTSNRLAFGPVYGKYEHGFLRDEIGLGGQIAFSFGRIKYGSFVNHVNAFDIGVLGFYHFNKLIPVQNLDVYAGVGFTIRSVSVTYDAGYSSAYGNSTDTGTGVYGAFRVGARYYVKPKLGLFADLGYDNMSVLNLGVTFKM